MLFIGELCYNERMAERKKHKVWPVLRILWNVGGIIFYFCYCGYLFYTGRGNLIVNYILLGVSILYALSFVVVTAFAHGRKKKIATTTAKSIYKTFRRLMLLYSGLLIGSSIVNLFVGPGRTFFMVLGMVVIIAVFAVQLIVRIAFEVVRGRFLTAWGMARKSFLRVLDGEEADADAIDSDATDDERKE